MSRRIVASLAVLILVSPIDGRADYKDDYRQGVSAAERGDWVSTERLMLEASAEQPASRGRGPLLRRYLPYYYLGLARANLGRCREAVSSFDESERQGPVVKAKKEYDSLQRQRTACRTLIDQADHAIASARGATDSAADVAARIAALAAEEPLATSWREGSPSFHQRQQAALQELSRARDELATGEASLDLAVIDRAQEAARSARSDLDALLDEASARQEDLVAVLDGDLGRLARLADAGTRDLNFVRRTLDPMPDEMAQHMDRLGAAIRRAEAVGRATSRGEIAARSDDVRRSLRDLRAAFQAPPEPLMDLATAFFAADYGRVAELLDPSGELLASTNPRVLTHVCIFSAAFHHASYILGGATDAIVLQRARTEALRCRDLEGVPAVLPSTFSPRFLELWQASAPLPPDDDAAPTE